VHNGSCSETNSLGRAEFQECTRCGAIISFKAAPVSCARRQQHSYSGAKFTRCPPNEDLDGDSTKFGCHFHKPSLERLPAASVWRMPIVVVSAKMSALMVSSWSGHKPPSDSNRAGFFSFARMWRRHPALLLPEPFPESSHTPAVHIIDRSLDHRDPLSGTVHCAFIRRRPRVIRRTLARPRSPGSRAIAIRSTSSAAEFQRIPPM